MSQYIPLDWSCSLWFEAHPRNAKHVKIVKILGRADDLIVLATGEKIRPTTMERTVAERVKDVLAYGEGQTSLGLIVELRASSTWNVDDIDSVRILRTSIDPFLAKGNFFMDCRGKISHEMCYDSTSTFKLCNAAKRVPMTRQKKQRLKAMEEIVEKYHEKLMGYAGTAGEKRRGLSEDEYDNGKASLHI